jgi:hypothetical protein
MRLAAAADAGRRVQIPEDDVLQGLYREATLMGEASAHAGVSMGPPLGCSSSAVFLANIRG